MISLRLAALILACLMNLDPWIAEAMQLSEDATPAKRVEAIEEAIEQIATPPKKTNSQLSESNEDAVVDLDQPQSPPSAGYRAVRLTLNPTAGQPLRGKIQLSWRLPTPPEFGPQSAYQEFAAKPIVGWEAPPGASLWFRGNKLVGSIAEIQMLGSVSEGKEPMEITIDVDAAGLASGQVVQADGSAVIQYRIDIDRIEGTRRHFQVHGVRIDHPEGRFALGPLPLGRQHQYRSFVQVADSWQIAMGPPFAVTQQDPVARLSLQMPPAVWLSGRVLNSFGEPAGGTPLSMSWIVDGSSRSVGSTVRANEEGRFRVAISSGEVPGECELSILPHDGSAGHSIVFPAGRFANDTDFGDLPLEPSATIHGFLVSADGTPQRNVTINLMPEQRDAAQYRGNRSGKSDDEGGFEIDGVERVPQVLHVFGKKVLDVTAPFELSQDPLGNERWVIEPFESTADVVIVVE